MDKRFILWLTIFILSILTMLCALICNALGAYMDVVLIIALIISVPSLIACCIRAQVNNPPEP